MQPCEFAFDPEPLIARQTVQLYAEALQAQSDAFNPYLTAGLAIVGLLLIALIYDLWALHTGHRTISQFMQHFSDWRLWFRVLGLTLVGLFGWHVFFGFPWSLRFSSWRRQQHKRFR